MLVAGAHGGEELEFGHLHRDIVVLGVETERTGHAAAARLNRLHLQIRNQPQHPLHRTHDAEGLLMTMAVQQYPRRIHRIQRQLQAFVLLFLK